MNWPEAVVVMPLRVGAVKPFGPNGEPSAIAKQPCAEPIELGVTGLCGDQQGDLRHHGGADKALHHYAAEHYDLWRASCPHVSAATFAPGAFGENVSTRGLTEQNVCVGDVFRLGNALLQVTQARQPCWKLNLRFGVSDMARRVQASAMTGWYYRVLQPALLHPGETLQLVERPLPQWPLARLLHYLYVEPMNPAALSDIAGLEVLPPSWRRLAANRLQTREVEDWSRRLDTPPRA